MASGELFTAGQRHRAAGRRSGTRTKGIESRASRRGGGARGRRGRGGSEDAAHGGVERQKGRGARARGFRS